MKIEESYAKSLGDQYRLNDPVVQVCQNGPERKIAEHHFLHAFWLSEFLVMRRFPGFGTENWELRRKWPHCVEVNKDDFDFYPQM